ncbi:hypothetical protein [Saccharomonospora azurea]
MSVAAMAAMAALRGVKRRECAVTIVGSPFGC